MMSSAENFTQHAKRFCKNHMEQTNDSAFPVELTLSKLFASLLK